ncbi:bifunctional diaminohydroxyphosphoribosylaminopyrimidine deaminase/5-amino-6-(5-phosphoribosylamino)uracil reductase RibD [Calidifontibacter terrae]
MNTITPSDTRWLDAALELAARGPIVDPNPRVGCVLVREERVVGEGFHRGAGTPHAEAMALRAAGESARGATAYVTLEPCSHVGRTPACADALIAAGVERVVFAAADPSPRAGGGAERLRAAGVSVERAHQVADRSRALNERWEFSALHGRPRVTWKFAATLDGRSAAADGSSRWITGEAARADAHRLRASVGAIVVGTGTAIADNPALTVRVAGPEVSTRRSSLAAAQPTSLAAAQPTSLAAAQPTSLAAAQPTGSAASPLRVVVGLRDLPAGAQLLDGRVETIHLRTHDPREVLDELHRREIRDVLLEGGPTLAAAFLAAGLVDRVIAYVAPALLGAGPTAVADLGITTIGDIRRFTIREVELLQPDLRIVLTDERHEKGAA